MFASREKKRKIDRVMALGEWWGYYVLGNDIISRGEGIYWKKKVEDLEYFVVFRYFLLREKKRGTLSLLVVRFCIRLSELIFFLVS